MASRARRPHAQLIYQDPYEALDPRYRVRATVEEPLRIHRVGASPAQRLHRVTRALARAGLTPPEQYLDRYPHELSGGQRQCVAIAASLVLDPRLLIADEPASMLDVSTRAAVLSTLDGLRRGGEMGILLITHDLVTAGQHADRIVVMYLGRIVEQGPAREVLHHPAHPYTKALLSAVPRLDPADRPERQILRDETPDPINIPTGCRFHPRCPSAQLPCREVDPELRRPDAAPPQHRAVCILV